MSQHVFRRMEFIEDALRRAGVHVAPFEHPSIIRFPAQRKQTTKSILIRNGETDRRGITILNDAIVFVMDKDVHRHDDPFWISRIKETRKQASVARRQKEPVETYSFDDFKWVVNLDVRSPIDPKVLKAAVLFFSIPTTRSFTVNLRIGEVLDEHQLHVLLDAFAPVVSSLHLHTYDLRTLNLERRLISMFISEGIEFPVLEKIAGHFAEPSEFVNYRGGRYGRYYYGHRSKDSLRFDISDIDAEKVEAWLLSHVPNMAIFLPSSFVSDNLIRRLNESAPRHVIREVGTQSIRLNETQYNHMINETHSLEALIALLSKPEFQKWKRTGLAHIARYTDSTSFATPYLTLEKSFEAGDTLGTDLLHFTCAYCPRRIEE